MNNLSIAHTTPTAPTDTVIREKTDKRHCHESKEGRLRSHTATDSRSRNTLKLTPTKRTLKGILDMVVVTKSKLQ